MNLYLLAWQRHCTNYLWFQHISSMVDTVSLTCLYFSMLPVTHIPLLLSESKVCYLCFQKWDWPLGVSTKEVKEIAWLNWFTPLVKHIKARIKCSQSNPSKEYCLLIYLIFYLIIIPPFVLFYSIIVCQFHHKMIIFWTITYHSFTPLSIIWTT